jgi:hypothetical protein
MMLTNANTAPVMILVNHDALLVLVNHDAHVVHSDAETDFSDPDIYPCLGVRLEGSPKDELYA